MTLQAGDQAPDFTLPNEDGEPISLSDLGGRKVVLYFYPKDDTPGCTTEACSIRDEFPQFEAKGAVVLGVSPDTSGSHTRFRSKYNLPFSLLADTDHKVAEAYGVWVTKRLMDDDRPCKEYEGVARTTFLIDEGGRIERIFNDVKPAEHTQELLEALSV